MRKEDSFKFDVRAFLHLLLLIKHAHVHQAKSKNFGFQL